MQQAQSGEEINPQQYPQYTEIEIKIMTSVPERFCYIAHHGTKIGSRYTTDLERQWNQTVHISSGSSFFYDREIRMAHHQLKERYHLTSNQQVIEKIGTYVIKRYGIKEF